MLPVAPGQVTAAKLMEVLPAQLHLDLPQQTQRRASPLPSLRQRPWQLATPLACLLSLRRWQQAGSLPSYMQRRWQW